MNTTEYDTALDLVDTDRAGTYAGVFGEGWTIGNAINGGVVMAVSTAAMQRRASADGFGRHRDPVAFSGYFLTASEPGPLTVTTEVLRSGRTLTTGQVSVTQPGGDGEPVERMRALLSLGDLGVGASPLRQPDPPPMPQPDACVASTDAPPSFLRDSSLLERLDLRLDPACVGWAVGQPSGQGEMRAWLRMADGREPDPTMLLLALDGLPPVAFDLGIPGWAPTLEFTAHVHARPAPGWLRLQVTSHVLAGSMMEEDARVWDSSGAMVAQSRQLCGVRLPQGWSPTL
ncbi:MAG: thioesterase family protein [Actinomycetota bacterium]|nr:thioesterase family protein [Actinomycetota bacterium]